MAQSVAQVTNLHGKFGFNWANAGYHLFEKEEFLRKSSEKKDFGIKKKKGGFIELWKWEQK